MSETRKTYTVETAVDQILSRSLNEGGFGFLHDQNLRSDSTAWGVMALAAANAGGKEARAACQKLSEIQRTDGRVSVVQGIEQAIWATPLSILAWKSLPGFEREIESAIQFLLQFSGVHTDKMNDAFSKHDASILGYPWIENTHSWIEPTGMAILALRAGGHGQHERVTEAGRMILDRQLPSGGWNYGNTIVFDKELYPDPVSTGNALCALCGLVSHDRVTLSLAYLQKKIKTIRTAMSLAWMIFGLGEWDLLMPTWQEFIEESLSLQKRYGEYNTVLLSQLVVACYTNGKILNRNSERIPSG